MSRCRGLDQKGQLGNDELFFTLQTSGTEGRPNTQKICRVELKQGYYEIKTEVVKPKLEMEWVEIRK